MKQKYYPPEYGSSKFHCIRCGVFALQSWYNLRTEVPNNWLKTPFSGSLCSHCKKWAYWYDGKMIVPSEAPVEPPHADLPEECVKDYLEARNIFSKSPRAAAALLRLSIQNLMEHLGERGKDIDDDIGELVKKGLSPTIQQALDVCRVIGKNAVHPGQLDVRDSPEVAQQMFYLINFIVDDRITRPKEVQDLYERLPEGARDAIEKREGISNK